MPPFEAANYSATKCDVPAQVPIGRKRVRHTDADNSFRKLDVTIVQGLADPQANIISTSFDYADL